MKMFFVIAIILVSGSSFNESLGDEINNDKVVENNVSTELDSSVHFRCWNRCIVCRNDCDGESCKKTCYDINAVCCEAGGKGPVHGGCGCM